VINEDIYNHPLKKFANKGREMVMILVEACGTKQNVYGIEAFVLKKYIG
jgi:hypothetical protein